MPRPCWRGSSPPSKAWPRSACSASPNMPCASRPIPPRWPPARSASTSWPPRSPAANVNLATGALNGATRSTIIHTDGQLNNAAEFNNQIIAYQQWQRRCASRTWRTVIDSAGKSLCQELVQGQARHRAGDLPPARLQHHRRDRHDQEGPAAVPGQPAAVGQAGCGVTTAARSIRASIDDVQITLLIAGVLVVGVIFVFLRTRLGHHHSRRWRCPSPSSAPSPAWPASATAWTIFR